MKKTEVVRLYTFSDAKLVTLGLEKVAFMRRDANEFLNFGITNPMIEALEASIDAFAETITDVEAVSDQSGITIAKDEQAEKLRVAIRNVMARVELRFGNISASAKYRKFGTETLSRQTDSELLITGKRVFRVGNEFLADLDVTGLTAGMLTDISDLSDQFEDLLIEVRLKIGERDIVQEDRVEEGNVVYNTISRYTAIGQTIWETSDVAKYNDYVIYNTPTGEAPTDNPNPFTPAA